MVMQTTNHEDKAFGTAFHVWKNCIYEKNEISIYFHSLTNADTGSSCTFFRHMQYEMHSLH
jgi:hypothetical protein